MNTISSESVADIKTLIAKLVDLTNISQPEPPSRPNPFEFEINSNSINTKIDALTAMVKQVCKQQPPAQTPTNFAQIRSTKNLYALMASKHAPETPAAEPSGTNQRPRQPSSKKRPSVQKSNMITLVQATKGGMAMTNHTVTAIITHLNSLL